MLDLQQFMQYAGQEFQVRRGRRFFRVTGVKDPENATITFHPDAGIESGDQVSSTDSEDWVNVIHTQIQIYNQQPFALVAEYETDSGDKNRTADTNGTGIPEIYALLAVAVVCLIVAMGAWVSNHSTEAFVAFVGTLVATLIGVGIAAYFNLRLFYKEARKRDKEQRQEAWEREEKQRQRLLQALAAELFTVLDILDALSPVQVPTSQNSPNVLRPVLAQLEPTAIEEAIRFGAGIFRGTGMAGLWQLSNLMREYSKASETLYPLALEWRVTQKKDPDIWRRISEDPEAWLRIYIASEEVLRLGENLTMWCTTVLVGLVVQGVDIEDVPRYRSDPSRVVQYVRNPKTP